MTRISSPASKSRIEYLGFRNVDDSREYRYAVHSASGSSEFRYRIGFGAFGRARVLIQDGPDLCYQQLVRELAEGDNPPDGSRGIREDELQAYRAAHTPVTRSTFAEAATRPAPPVAGEGRR